MIRHGNDRSHILILDDSDINSFFVDIEQLLFNMMFPKGRGNFGSTELCNFQCHRPDQKFGTLIRDIGISSMAHRLDSRRERGNIQANLLCRKLPSILSVSCFLLWCTHNPSSRYRSVPECCFCLRMFLRLNHSINLLFQP